MRSVPTLIFHRVNTIPKYFVSVVESTERKIEDCVSSSDNVKFFSNVLIFNRKYICNFKTQSVSMAYLNFSRQQLASQLPVQISPTRDTVSSLEFLCGTVFYFVIIFPLAFPTTNI